MEAAAPPPLDLTPVRFETPVGDLTSAVVVETEDAEVTIIEPTLRLGDRVTLRLSTQSTADPRFVSDIATGMELGELTLTILPSRPVRAFALPPGAMQTSRLLRQMGMVSVAALGALGLITFVLISSLPAPAKAFLVVALLALAGLVPVISARLRPPTRHSYLTGGHAYPLDRVLDGTPAAQAAAALVARVKEEYGALLSDICYRIENPALFDPADTAAKRLATALIRWDDGQGRLDPSELSVAAAEVRVAFDAAKSHAETVGMAYLPKGAQPKAQTALKAARLARSTKAPAERAAALRQVSAILEGLSLYYLPNPAEATLMIDGRPVLALPGRVARDEAPDGER